MWGWRWSPKSRQEIHFRCWGYPTWPPAATVKETRSLYDKCCTDLFLQISCIPKGMSNTCKCLDLGNLNLPHSASQLNYSWRSSACGVSSDTQRIHEQLLSSCQFLQDKKLQHRDNDALTDAIGSNLRQEAEVSEAKFLFLVADNRDGNTSWWSCTVGGRLLLHDKISIPSRDNVSI